MDNEFRHTNPEIDVHAMGEMHEHPTWKEYKWVALILTLITTLLVGHGADESTQEILIGVLILVFVGVYGRDQRVRDRV